jgi:ABC-2 type transport system permease protein
MPVPPETAAASDRAGVIHDIGYRDYTGPRLGRGYATRSLFVYGLRGAYGLGRSAKSKVLPMLLLAGMAVPAVIVVATAVFGKSKTLPVDYAEYLSATNILTVIFLAAQAPVALSRDLRFMTVPLYFSRPLTRGDYVRAKAAAMAVALFALTALPVLILYVGALLAGMPFGHNTLHALYGLAAALLYAVLYAAVGLTIAATTPRRGFGVAAIIAVLTISSAVSGICVSLIDGDAANWAGMLSPNTLVVFLCNWLSGVEPYTPPGTVGVLAFIAEYLAITAACYGLLMRRYRKF